MALNHSINRAQAVVLCGDFNEYVLPDDCNRCHVGPSTLANATINWDANGIRQLPGRIEQVSTWAARTRRRVSFMDLFLDLGLKLDNTFSPAHWGRRSRHGPLLRTWVRTRRDRLSGCISRSQTQIDFLRFKHRIPMIEKIPGSLGTCSGRHTVRAENSKGANFLAPGGPQRDPS